MRHVSQKGYQYDRKKTVDVHQAVKTIKNAILQSQYRAAKGVNREQLSLYFGIGRYISEHSRKGFWGTGAIDRISEQLQKELPGLRGFGVSSIKNMRQFYEEWVSFLNRQPVAGELTDSANRSPMAAELSMDEFVSLGFTHHIEIMNKVKSDLFHHQDNLPNNFSTTMQNTRNALQAIGMFKDEYLLDFINVEELGVRDQADIDERVVENAIVHNVKNFIMTFGRDFAFVGNQYHLEKFGHDEYPDLLFYNRELAALVAVELKQGKFKPAYLGQLSAYLRILDTEVKKPFGNISRRRPKGAALGRRPAQGNG